MKEATIRHLLYIKTFDMVVLHCSLLFVGIRILCDLSYKTLTLKFVPFLGIHQMCLNTKIKRDLDLS